MVMVMVMVMMMMMMMMITGDASDVVTSAGFRSPALVEEVYLEPPELNNPRHDPSGTAIGLPIN